MKTLLIDSVIGTGEGEISAKMVRDWVAELNGTEPVLIKIHSEGGSVIEGFAIHDALAAYPGEKHFSIESMAFSIASLIPMSGKVKISPNGYMMLHNPYVSIEGTGEDLAKTSALLNQYGETMVKAYAAKTGLEADAVRAIMKAETFLNAQRAVELGFADSITESPIVGRAVNPQSLLKLPHGVVMALFGNSPDQQRETKMSQTVTRVAATAKAIKAKFPRAKSDFVVKCMEKEMTMEEVTDEYMEETEEESQSLKAQVNELMARVKAMESEKEKEVEAVKAKAEEEKKEIEAKAKLRSGVAPIGGIGGGSGGKDGDPRAQWLDVINGHIKAGVPRAKAVSLANKTHPEIREAMVEAAGVRKRK